MAGLITHKLFADEVFQKFGKEKQKMLKDSLSFYHVFSQSFDFFLFHKKKKIRKFQHYTHQVNTQSYLINLIREILSNKLENSPEALGYLYGSINHYVLDSVTHPYIYYKSGVFDKKVKESFKYKELHTRMEFMLDCFMYESKHKKRFYKYKFKNDVFPKIKPSKELINLINITYKKTYNKNNIAKEYFRAYKYSKILFHLFIYDPLGIKKISYKINDLIFRTKYVYRSFHIKCIDYTLLNINRKEWFNPADKSLKQNSSFIDLYNEAVKKSVHIIENVDKVLKKEKDIKSLLDIIPNISYVTGLPIMQNKPAKYFEF